MSDNDQVEGDTADCRQVRGGPSPNLFWIQATVHEDVKIPNLNEQRVGSNPAIAVKVD